MAGVGRGGKLSLGLLLGGIVGIALGLLLAPKRGEETRSRVRSRAEPVAERIRDTVTRVARRGEHAVEQREQATESDVEVEGSRRQRSGLKPEAAKEESPSEEAGDSG